jgi:chorismate synthase
MLRWLTAGESHGPALVAILEGLPAGVQVTTGDVAAGLARRRGGYGRGARMSFEQDEVEFLGGVRHGLTLGGPVAIQIGNSEWPKWRTVMAADPVDADELDRLARNAPLTRPRPGHADLVGMQKYGFTDARPVLERSSARETAARVAVGVVARAFLAQALGVRLLSHVVSIGTACSPDGQVPGPDEQDAVDASPVRCLDAAASAAMVAEVDAARKDGDTLGGVVEVVGYGLPPGLGSHVHWDRRLDARLAAALMSIQAIKGVEIGDGFATAELSGEDNADEMRMGNENKPVFLSNHAGGILGGISTGQPIVARFAVKPTSSILTPRKTVDRYGRDTDVMTKGRHDPCVGIRAVPIGEAMVACVLADHYLMQRGQVGEGTAWPFKK